MTFWEQIKQFFSELFSGKAPTTEDVKLEKDPVYTVEGTVKLHSQGNDVTVVQTRLKQLGYDISIDGDFGNRTLAVVKQFQKANGLTADGIVGAKTLEKLGINIVQFPPTEVPGDVDLSTLTKGTNPWYTAAFNQMTYDNGFETTIANVAKRCLANKGRYQAVSTNFNGMPWYFIAALHNMEASGSFAGVLHNGEKIIGTDKKTTLVPKGRGPFSTWEDAAVDALTLKNFHKVSDWTIGNMLRLAEQYNGTGYLKYHQEENSPYLWSQSSINDGKGKYVADGKWDSSANANGQTGFAVVLREILRIENNVIPIGGTPEEMIVKLNPNINPEVVKAASRWFDYGTNKNLVVLIDFTKSEKEARFHLVDMRTFKATNYKVAHGSKSDTDKDGFPTNFSNQSGSNMSSLGAMVIAEKYASSKFKYARRIDGLEKGKNDAVRARAVVWHSSTYVNDTVGQSIGDSLGCFAMSEATASKLIDSLGGVLLYAYYK